VGAAISAGADPVAFIKKYPGRIYAMHVKDYDTGGKGFEVLVGEGSAKWKEIFQLADKIGGIEFYIVEQEGSGYPPLETVERCFKTMKKLRA
jgi:sugar phosphate isomerase/epimerase